MLRIPWRALASAIAIASMIAIWGTGIATAKSSVRGAAARQQALRTLDRKQGGSPSPNHTPDDGDMAHEAAQYDFERSLPAASVSGQALVDAQQQAQGLAQKGGGWQDFTTQPYNATPSNYTDPFWSNIGSGFSIVGGRTTALAQTAGGTWFAGTADGGVWRSTDQGQHWTPVFDSMPSLSIGALTVDPTDGSLWVGTGEANLSQDSYAVPASTAPPTTGPPSRVSARQLGQQPDRLADRVQDRARFRR